MTSFTSIPTASRWRDALRSVGCNVTPASVAGISHLGEDSFAMIRFGNDVKDAADSIPTMRVSCVLRLAGQSLSDRLSRWIIEKTVISPVVPGGIRICVELDLLVAGAATAASLRAGGSDLYTHLQALISDARDTLNLIPVSGDIGKGRADAGPVVHIEAVTIGDLVAGRSGLVRGGRSGFGKSEISLRLAACDVLAYEIAPEVIKALRTGLRAETSIAPAAPGEERTRAVAYERVSTPAQSLDHLFPALRIEMRFANGDRHDRTYSFTRRQEPWQPDASRRLPG